MKIKIVELPTFNGEDLVGCFTREDTHFEELNTSEKVK